MEGNIDQLTQKQPLEQLLIEILNTLSLINNKIYEIVKSNERILEINETLLEKIISKHLEHGKTVIHPDSMTLLSLPKTLRKTALVLYKLEQATADDLAKGNKTYACCRKRSCKRAF